MNYGSKKTILKALLVWQIIVACFYIPSMFLYFLYYAYLSNIAQAFYGITLPSNIFTIIYFCLYIVYFAFFINYIPRKYKQTKEVFHQKKIFFRIFAVLSIFFDVITAILLIITAFKKDDGKEEIVYIKPEREKPQKLSLTESGKQQLKALKSQRRKGIISKENFERQKKEIIKKEKLS